MVDATGDSGSYARELASYHQKHILVDTVRRTRQVRICQPGVLGTNGIPQNLAGMLGRGENVSSCNRREVGVWIWNRSWRAACAIML